MLQIFSTQVKIYECRMGWCPESFPNELALVEHVKDHIRKAPWIRRGDLPAIVRAEEGLGESMSLSAGMIGLSSPFPSQVGKVVRVETSGSQSQPSQVAQPTSSLPSPPQSNHAPSPHLQTFNAFDSGDLASQPEFTVDPNDSPIVGGFGDSPAFSFRSTSQDGSPQKALVIPTSPGLDTLVLQGSLASKKRKARDFVSSMSDSRRALPPSVSMASHVSNSSVASVERQLTQSMDFDDDEGVLERYIHTDQFADSYAGLSSQAESQVYAGEIFQSQVKSSAQPFTSQPMPSEASQQRQPESQSSSEGNISASSNLEPPPPGQPQPSTSTVSSQKSAPFSKTSHPFSQHDSLASQAHPSTSFPIRVTTSPVTPVTTVSPATLQSSSKSRTGNPSRRVFQSGTLPHFGSQDTNQVGPSAKPATTRALSAIERAPDGGLIHRHFDRHQHHQPGTSRDEDNEPGVEDEGDSEDFESQDRRYAIQTQAPYDSQAMDF
ncbi:hypothetical protein CC2G_010219 [Coprinopsis cinerea AmutBmut pab1-1]|nr:hypothetical protein CC2G_010219 [Coprinopsis cinerea AmutBmut pab1-1]